MIERKTKHYMYLKYDRVLARAAACYDATVDLSPCW